MSDDSIRVIARFRPVNEREKNEIISSEKEGISIDFRDEKTVQINIPSKDPMLYTFDRVFHGKTKQKEVFELAAKEVVEDVIKGYNGTIFAYGQTGSGKSFTMFGPDIDSEEDKGIIPRACQYIFKHINESDNETVYEVTCSFLEIYKEVIKDLLHPKNINLKVRETPSRGVWVEGLSSELVSNEADILMLLRRGEEFRSVASTNMNATSSRSHSLFILTLTQKEKDGTIKIGKLNLADLAGSEKVGKTGAMGETLEEAKKINQSLSALGNCIMSLTKAKRGHVPYRDSKLTFILRESLGGNAKTTLLIACSPHSFNLEETISTLRFGQRAKTIKNKAKINQQRSVEELELIVKKLTRELALLKKYVKRLENELQLAKGESFDIEALRNQIYEEIKKVDKSSKTETVKEEQSQQTNNNNNDISNNQNDIVTTPRRSQSSMDLDVKSPRSYSNDKLVSSHSRNNLSDESDQDSQRSDNDYDEEYETMMLVDDVVEFNRYKELTTIKIQDLEEELSNTKEELEKYMKEVKMLKEKLANIQDDKIKKTKVESQNGLKQSSSPIIKSTPKKPEEKVNNNNKQTPKNNNNVKQDSPVNHPVPRRRKSIASLSPPGLLEELKDTSLVSQHIFDNMLLALKLDALLKGEIFSPEFDKRALFNTLVTENVTIGHWHKRILKELLTSEMPIRNINNQKK